MASKAKTTPALSVVGKKQRARIANYFRVVHGEDTYLAKAYTKVAVRKYVLRGGLSIERASTKDLLDFNPAAGEVVDLTQEGV